MNSFEVQRPGIKPRFFNQKIEQNDPEKKIPSTAAKAIRRSAKLPFFIQRSAHCAFLVTHGTVSIACNKCVLSAESLI